MPIYEFKCKNCKHEYEIYKKFSETNKDYNCPKCKSDFVDRVVSKNNFKLKGQW